MSTATYPPPPPYYRLYKDYLQDPKSAPEPPPPIEGTYVLFGSNYTVKSLTCFPTSFWNPPTSWYPIAYLCLMWACECIRCIWGLCKVLGSSLPRNIWFLLLRLYHILSFFTLIYSILLLGLIQCTPKKYKSVDGEMSDAIIRSSEIFNWQWLRFYLFWNMNEVSINVLTFILCYLELECMFIKNIFFWSFLCVLVFCEFCLSVVLLKLSCSLWFVLNVYVQVCSVLFLPFPFVQTDDVLPNLEEQGVRQLYPKGPNVGNVRIYFQKAVFVPTVILMCM